MLFTKKRANTNYYYTFLQKTKNITDERRRIRFQNIRRSFIKIYYKLFFFSSFSKHTHTHNFCTLLFGYLDRLWFFSLLLLEFLYIVVLDQLTNSAKKMDRGLLPQPTNKQRCCDSERGSRVVGLLVGVEKYKHNTRKTLSNNNILL